MQRIPQQDLRAHSELAAFYISPPTAKSVFNIFSTHPPMEKRIAQLSRLEAQLQGTTPGSSAQALSAA
jgi:heat shock protein HtpX